MPATSVPTKLPQMRLPVEPAPTIAMPMLPLPETRLRAAPAVPPTVLPVAPFWTTAPEALPRAAVPPTSVPILFPTTRLPDVPAPVMSRP